jgi:hypothetical protein
MFVYGQDKPINNIPSVASQTNIESNEEKQANPLTFAYGTDIHLEGLTENE